METHQNRPIPAQLSNHKQMRATYLLGALLALGIVALMAVWLLTRGGSGTISLPAVGSAAAVSEAQLHALAKQTDHPIYWAGSKQGTYELTRLADGRIYIRYLPSADKVGVRSATYLTVGTYPAKHAYRSLQRAAARKGGVAVKIDKGGLLVFNASTANSVYFGYPSANYQVEVFDPSPTQARSLVLAGRVTPIG
jgi:hypothetical protein